MRRGLFKPEPIRNRYRARCVTRGSRPRWTSTPRSSPRRSAERYSSSRSLHESIHGPLRSNKTGFSMIGHGEQSRQVTEKIGGAGRDRTGDLIVANDALSQLSYSPTNRNG